MGRDYAVSGGTADSVRDVLEKKQFLFIIGAPRSGTTMLQVLLASHPQVATTVELTLFDRYLGPWLATWETEVRQIEQNGWKQGLPMMWSRDDFDDFQRDFLARIYAKLAQRHPGATHILDKHPGYSLHVANIKRLLPRARFIHIVRDGRDVACSLRAAQATLGFGFERLAQGGMLWKKMLLGARNAAEWGSDYLELRYERFVADQIDAYAHVLDFCGLPADREWIARTLEENTFEKMKQRRATGEAGVHVSTHHYRQGKAGSWRDEFTLRDRFEFDRVSGELLCELGYAQPGWWAETPFERRLEPWRHEARRRHKWLQRVWENGRAVLLGGRQQKSK